MSSSCSQSHKQCQLQISAVVIFREQKHRSASKLHSCSVLLSLPCCGDAVGRCGDARAPKLPARHGVMAWARAPAQGSSEPCELDPVASGLLIRRCVRELRVAGFCSALCNRILGRRGEAWCEPAVPVCHGSRALCFNLTCRNWPGHCGLLVSSCRPVSAAASVIAASGK